MTSDQIATICIIVYLLFIPFFLGFFEKYWEDADLSFIFCWFWPIIFPGWVMYKLGSWGMGE